MLKKAACLIILGLFVAPVACMANNSSKEKAAVTATEAWLHLVDQGKYAQSWKECAPYFRNAVSEQKWEHTMETLRRPLGKVISRHLKTDEYRTSLPGAPNGQYVVMQFNTSFTHKKSAVETVTAELGKNGKWGVIGYFFR